MTPATAGTPVIAGTPATTAHPVASTPVALVDLLDRVLGAGVVITGDLVLSIADVDLVHISLRAFISSVRARAPRPPDGPPPW